jgi:hypothetical protein
MKMSLRESGVVTGLKDPEPILRAALDAHLR